MASNWTYRENCTCPRCESERAPRIPGLVVFEHRLQFAFFLVMLGGLLTMATVVAREYLGRYFLLPLPLVGALLARGSHWVWRKLDWSPMMRRLVAYPTMIAAVAAWGWLCLDLAHMLARMWMESEKESHEREVREWLEKPAEDRDTDNAPAPTRSNLVRTGAYLLSAVCFISPIFAVMLLRPRDETEEESTAASSETDADDADRIPPVDDSTSSPEDAASFQ